MQRAAAVALVAAVVGHGGLLAQPASQPADTDVHRDRLDRYLQAYEPLLSTVIADEEMTQRTRERQWVFHNRRIHSEVAFIGLPGGAGWMGFRRVIKVNGKAVGDRSAPLAQLMMDGQRDDYDRARQLLADSAAHNLGAPRTINLPNLPLELLHPRHRHRFLMEIVGRERIRGTDSVLLRLEEIGSPTIIQQRGGGDMKTLVSAWIEPASGRLLRAQVSSRDVRIGMSPFDAVVRVDFRHDAKVGMLVPSEMNETFFVGRGVPAGLGRAKYSNYRSFATSGRIVPQ